MSGSPIIAHAVRHALLMSVLSAASAVQAQDDRAIPLEEVIVTGTSIRRVDAESSLPVQVLDSATIAKTGAASVVDLLQKLPAIQNSTMEAESVGGSTFGFAGVSLHNVGENRTLVLLNGRRLAQFGGQTLTGFAAAVDLNSIPVSAIERVEILTSGASALYGSDAVAGVVNFITKDRSTDRGISVNYYGPEDGAREKGINISGGLGDYGEDGWNLFVTLAGDERTELNAVDRSFADSAIVNFKHEGQRWTFFNGSARNIPANVIATGGSLADSAVSLEYLNTGECPENSAPVGSGCYFDHVRFIQIYPKRERKTAMTSLNVKVGEDHNFFLDGLWSQAKQTSKTAPVPGELAIAVGSPLYNTYLAGVTDENGDPLFPGVDADADGSIDPIVASYRAFDLGQRIDNDKANFYQLSTGLEGQVAGWDYDFALTQSESDVKGNISGYPGALGFANLLASGLVNPFVGPGEQSQAGVQGLESISYNGYWDGGVSKLQTAELRGSRALFDLPNGKPVMLGAGLSYYKEKFRSKPSQFAQANLDDPVAGTPAAGGPGTGDQRFGDAAVSVPYSANREVFGAYAEVLVQPLEWLELTGSGRFDDYDDVGNTTNYKLSFKLTPVKQILIRGSYGTGFHAPTVPQINATRQSYGVTNSSYDPTPELQAIASSLGAQLRPAETQYDVFAGGNQGLTPEKSRQATFGVMYEPSPRWSIGADYWWIAIKDAFGQIEEGEAFDNPSQYPDAWTTLTDIGTGTTYLAYDKINVNTGKEYYSGIDFTTEVRLPVSVGNLRSQLAVTRMLTTKVQLSKDGPYYENIGDYSSSLDEVTFKWAGRLLTTFDHGNWSHTVTLNFRSGYKDKETLVDGIDEDGNFNGELAAVRLHVDRYYTFDWQSNWTPMPWLQLTVGALNLFDKDPPLSLTDYNFQVGYDARYYDPRGRVVFGQATVKF